MFTRNMTRSVALAAALIFPVAPLLAEDVKIVYPSNEETHFVLMAPEDWELEPAEEEGGYFSLTGPSGVVLSFRSIPASSEGEGKENLEAAIKEAFEFLEEQYTDVKTDEIKEDTLNGLTGFVVTGTGKSKDDQEPAIFAMAWYAVKGHIGEMWVATTPDDKEGIAQATKIIKTFKAP